MSTEVKTKESLFSKKNQQLLKDPFNDNNPITVHALNFPQDANFDCHVPIFP